MLAVCGDSFSYGTKQNTWPKILADKLNMPIVNLSLVAGSNYSICFQLQHILNNYKPELIIISLTAVDRFEVDSEEFEKPANITDFNYKVDEVKNSPFSKKPSILSGGVKYHNKYMTRSFRLEAQYQSWCIQYLMSKVNCNYRIYRNIFPCWYKDITKYNDTDFYGLENLSGWRNSGPYDFEKEHLKGNESTNHLSVEENLKFAEWVYNDLQ